mmetsp:Transcript_4615/g.9176  ORF Transcript_4615/g.9176 Transcript_4615/m.9176 type:complete len:411 (+) Transcript_4615:113-1345(+)
MVSTPLGHLLCLLLRLVAFATSSSAVSSVRSSLVSNSINRKISIRLVERINKKDDIDPFEPISPHASLTYPTISESPSTVPTTATSVFPNNIPTNIPSFFPIKGPSFSLSPQMQKEGDGIKLANDPYDSAAPTSSPLDFIYDATPNDKASSIQHTLSLQMFLPNFTTLDGQDIGIFERSIRNFVVGHAHDINMPPEVSIQIMTAVVVRQVLKWAQKNRVRSQNGDAPLGLNVYYEMDVVATGEILKTQLEDSIQAMFDQNPGLFEEELRYAFARRNGKTSESNSSTESESVSIDAMAATTIACGVFIAFILGGLFVYKINKKETDEDPPLNSPRGKRRTQYLFAKKQMISGYPTQQPRSQSDRVLDLEIVSPSFHYHTVIEMSFILCVYFRVKYSQIHFRLCIPRTNSYK